MVQAGILVSTLQTKQKKKKMYALASESKSSPKSVTGQLGDLGAAAAAAAKSLQSCPTLCNPIDGSPLGSSVPGILQARILEWVTISFSKA